MNIKGYVKASDRGDFQWQPTEADNCTGQVLVESCSYKNKSMNIRLFGSQGEYEIEIDDLENEPFYICGSRSSRKYARIFAERVIRNDQEGNWKNNLKYA